MAAASFVEGPLPMRDAVVVLAIKGLSEYFFCLSGLMEGLFGFDTSSLLAVGWDVRADAEVNGVQFGQVSCDYSMVCLDVLHSGFAGVRTSGSKGLVSSIAGAVGCGLYLGL